MLRQSGSAERIVRIGGAQAKACGWPEAAAAAVNPGQKWAAAGETPSCPHIAHLVGQGAGLAEFIGTPAGIDISSWWLRVRSRHGAVLPCVLPTGVPCPWRNAHVLCAVAGGIVALIRDVSERRLET